MSAREVVLVIIFLGLTLGTFAAVHAQTEDESQISAKAFLKAAEVLTHPRCVNCHPQGDRPLQGDDSHIHFMHIERGPEGMGKNGLLCSACHQDTNLPGEHMPPGAPGWQLPPANMPMAFEKVTPRILCQHLKDPGKNGQRTPNEVIEHVETAPLVAWGWDPGEGRTPVAMSHEDFVQYMREWFENGAACPE